ncbi:signal transduction histidine kinase [Brevundimonas sp. SORGH_AS 993]|nr:signal transduction histidine kinase [Brevundimonas sp. SORGH_AS_0993]
MIELPRGIQVTVADKRPSVADADLERIIEPFVRAETSRSRQAGGIGLGLTIARDFAVELGGSLTLHHRQGEGLVAKVTLVSDRVNVG